MVSKRAQFWVIFDLDFLILLPGFFDFAANAVSVSAPKIDSESGSESCAFSEPGCQG